MTNVWKEIIYDVLPEEVIRDNDKKLFESKNTMSSLINVEKNKNIFKTVKNEDGHLALIIENGYENSRDVVYNNAEPIVNHKEFERICLKFSSLEEIKKVSNLMNRLVKEAKDRGY